ncbi:MAG: lipase maturation factor family protein [Gammaproteobacteria bacterium]
MSGADGTGRYALISALFLRLLALIYFTAFVSTGIQIVGLAGDQGILPVADAVEEARAEYGPWGWLRVPTLVWFFSSNDALFAIALTGCVFSVALFLNVLPRLALLALFVLYLSLFQAGQLFMNFQWDYMLLESGFLALFLAGGSRPAVWLFRWLLFRIRFLSGMSKILSGDPTWANLTTLSYFFEVQPLPHWGGWYAHQLPEWLLRVATGSVLVIEILVPFLMFMPRRIRFIGAWATILMQVTIILTSNHNYANVLVLVLCLFLFDDRAVGRVVPATVVRWINGEPAAAPSGAHQGVTWAVAAVIFTASLFEMWTMLSGRDNPEPVAKALGYLRPYHIVHNYHIFPTMPTERLELIIEGSLDGREWRTYEFKYKPGDVMRRPEVIAPHHPRVDWMMWFVPQSPMFLPWFEQFVLRLSEGSPAVLDLMANNPFPGERVPNIRVSLYRYHFASPELRRETGQWWEREYLGPFYPMPGIHEGAGPPEAP